ncbi:MAG: hypothetical protein H6R47_697 [Proteobacteria bacterium]|nr:hypothetical protein [Pseudomonadota bacterium]
MPPELAAKLAMLSAPPGLYYSATVAGLMVLLRLSRQFGAVFLLITFPVTLAHELTHLVLGYLTGGQPSGLRLLPRRSARGYILGSVTCNNVRWYNGLFIGLAPLLLLPLALALLSWRLHAPPEVNALEAVWAFALACLVYASLPSWQDIRVALASSWLLITVLVVTAIAGTGSW